MRNKDTVFTRFHYTSIKQAIFSWFFQSTESMIKILELDQVVKSRTLHLEEQMSSKDVEATLKNIKNATSERDAAHGVYA